MFSAVELTNGLDQPHHYLSIYIDAYKTKTSHNQSSEGVYMSILNTSRREIFTLMVLPPGCDLHEALAPLRRDLIKLQKGIYVYDVATQTIVNTRAYVAAFVADTIQADKTCRSLGNAGLVHGRTCSAKKRDYADSKHDCNDYTCLRRLEQSNIVLLQQKEEVDQHGTSTADIQRHYGLKDKPFLFEGVQCDPHKQSFWDIDHLFWYGVSKLVFDLELDRLYPRHRHEVLARLQAFPWPAGTRTPMPVITGKSYGSGVSFGMYQILTYALPFIFDGIDGVQDQTIVFLTLLARTLAAAAGPLTKATLAQVQKDMSKIVEYGILCIQLMYCWCACMISWCLLCS